MSMWEVLLTRCFCPKWAFYSERLYSLNIEFLKPWPHRASTFVNGYDADACCGLYRHKLMWAITSVNADAWCDQDLKFSNFPDSAKSHYLKMTVIITHVLTVTNPVLLQLVC